MNRSTKKKYTPKFKQQTVELVRLGKSVPGVAQELNIGDGILYAWVKKSQNASQKEDRNIGLAIQRIFKLHRSRYGHRRIWHELRDEGIVCSPSRVSRLMAERGLRAIQPRTFIPRTMLINLPIIS